MPIIERIVALSVTRTARNTSTTSSSQQHREPTPRMEAAWWFGILLKGLLGAAILALAGFVGIPLVLAAITVWRGKTPSKPTVSSLYVGRVWHTRFLPKHHGFQYPLFLFALDLEEVDDLFFDQLWPLCLIVKFRNEDHLKNGEGCKESIPRGVERHEIAHRVLRLVAEKTKGSCQPTLETYRVILVTHLCYYGYCFNPVSFYYLQDKASNKLVAVVGEVSNTPWNEMHCYVLHPESSDNVQVKADAHNDSVNYQFPKRFHVSPFMEMNFTYDWTFTNFQLDASTNDGIHDSDSLRVLTVMKRGEKEVHFTAKFECLRHGMNPTRIAWQLIQYPIYCAIIQIWIHYEAFWLFVKGVVFVPHPKDSNTAASQIIGAIMTPLFALKDWVDQVTSSKSASSSSPDASSIKPKTN